MIRKAANQTRYGQEKEVKFTIAFFKKWLEDNDIEMHSTNNEGKSVVAERLIRTSKKNYNHMMAISGEVYIDKLKDVVNEYSNTYHKTSKMTPVDVKDNTYIDSSKQVNDKDPKFKVGDPVRISKHKNIFAKGYTSKDILHIGLKKFF